MRQKPALRSELAVGEALRAIAHDVLIDARLAIEKSGSSSTAAVHEFRRQMKCWRALLRLLEPFVGEDAHQLRVTARDLARDLGAARDPQSAREAFDDLTEHGLPLSDRAIKSVRRCIDDLRTKGENHALSPKMRRRIDETLTEASDALDRWPLHVLTFPDLAKQLTASYRAARRAVPKRWFKDDPEALHELRKLVVIHRYQMQIVEPLWQRFTKMWLGEAQRLRERLGQYQDLEVLQQFTKPNQPLAHWHSQLDRPIAARKHRHVIAAKRTATRLFVDRPSEFRRRLIVMWKAA
jgi:CHAD domain-containing protein